jgi:ABC-type hemin transport system ATPase subunit
MDVIRKLADRIIVLHNGALAADGDPATVMASDVVQEAYMGKETLPMSDPILDHSGVQTDIAQYHILQGRRPDRATRPA